MSIRKKGRLLFPHIYIMKKPESSQFQKEAVIQNLYQHVEYLSVKIGERHLWKEESLERTADYIESAFTSYGYSVWRQTYSCYGKDVSNLIVEKKGEDKESVVIGAHYDTVPGTPGADDNASAVAGLLELARLHREAPNKKTLLFVAFANEEPPCFGFPNMGSMVYARHLKEKKTSVEVMVSLEMIGFFRPERIQNYPLPGMSLFYPKTADFIGVVGNFRIIKMCLLLQKRDPKTFGHRCEVVDRSGVFRRDQSFGQLFLLAPRI